MESREVIMPAAVETKAPEAPSSHQLVLATNSPTQTANPTQVMGPQGFSTETSGGFPSSLAKKKRGRPRKYGPDGTAVTGRTLSPMPLSASSPTSGGYSDSKLGEFRAEKKKRKMNSAAEKSNMFLGDQITSGGSFTPHMVTVNPGEDVTSKIISFSKYGPRAICVLSALGIISHVTLRQGNSSGGTVTYEGRFEILSLSGSFTPGEVGGISSREGGMSIALSSPDGRVVGGLLAGLLTAAGPVQVVVASFLPDAGNSVGPKPRKPKNTVKLLTPVADPTAHMSTNTEEQNFNEQSQESPTNSTPTPTDAPHFQHENRSPMPGVHDWRRAATDMNVSLRED
ncbi:putative AT-hook motif nuclear-localized protein [Helianthus annuus]|uniref:AT-hook motif nuclear-localized protein n=2 Tax=Helianthus annuus TaxID=4232 RepID=A0A9K3NYJ1_HELAN|nr:AT-hook motif nuclear-localized protein 1 [Helianthus annuus]XP_022030190.1 AT-hook motif nuclear-localized protein 1 [Helianthus annuus]XP_022030191.1 AT-hook motif nuclear-localized protein 1 [Helianthus annuus]KAF5816770.1 putative AT-hook motif nuclear-localized protein [Helianthus annuus]KAJ0775815.1 putative AT-hook motif nuclear-localized protein [Helianthus annuus]KAJ0938118.1 putative AT-hook motif nuclear-localized protein [Helianthus annuus]KAJ0946015.1 putative AT-hook motif nu